jgi:MFS family permease
MSSRLRTLFFMNLGHAYDHLFMLLYPTAVLALERDFQASYAELIALSVWGFITFGAGTLPAGWLGDHWSRRGMMAIFFIGIGAASIATGLASGPIGIALGLAAIGLFASIYHPIGIAIVSETAAQAGLGRAMGINGVFGNLGVAGAGITAGVLVDLISWRAAFIVPGVISIVTGLAYLALTAGAADLGAAKKRAPTAIARADQVRVFWVLVVATLFGGIIFHATTIGMPKVFDERLTGLVSSATGIGGWVFVVFTVAAVAQLVVGQLIDRYPLKPVFVGVAVLQAPLLALAAVATDWTMIAAAILVMLAVFGTIPIHDVIVARYTTAEWRSRLYSVKYVFSFGVSAAAVPLIAGLHAWGGGFLAMFLVLAACAAVFLAAALAMPGARAPVAAPAPAE